MYLSKLVLNPASRRVRTEIGRPYELHRTLMHAFPSAEEGTGAGPFPSRHQQRVQRAHPSRPIRKRTRLEAARRGREFPSGTCPIQAVLPDFP